MLLLVLLLETVGISKWAQTSKQIRTQVFKLLEIIFLTATVVELECCQWSEPPPF